MTIDYTRVDLLTVVTWKAIVLCTCMCLGGDGTETMCVCVHGQQIITKPSSYIAAA